VSPDCNEWGMVHYNTLWGTTVFPPLLVVAALLPLPLQLERTLFCIDMVCVCCALLCVLLWSPMQLGPPTPVHWPSPAVFKLHFSVAWPKCQSRQSAISPFSHFAIFAGIGGFLCGARGTQRAQGTVYELYCIVLYCSSLVS
jgi:hypothetical protein